MDPVPRTIALSGRSGEGANAGVEMLPITSESPKYDVKVILPLYSLRRCDHKWTS